AAAASSRSRSWQTLIPFRIPCALLSLLRFSGSARGIMLSHMCPRRSRLADQTPRRGLGSVPMLERAPWQLVRLRCVGPVLLERLAYDLGYALAQAGFTVVTGGLGGVMAATSRGAQTARAAGQAPPGALVVGILPGDDPRRANPFCDVVIATGLGEARNLLVV